MVGKTKHRTQADNERLDILSAYCLPCVLEGWPGNRGTIQHVTEGGRRLEDEHQATYPACEWHHLGERPVITRECVPMGRIEELFGPSFARNKRAYQKRYGTERQLIAVADQLVAAALQARRRGEFLSERESRKIIQRSHKAIVRTV